MKQVRAYAPREASVHYLMGKVRSRRLDLLALPFLFADPSQSRPRVFITTQSTTYILAPQICKRLGRTQRAMRHLVMAMDLDPKDANLVKARGVVRVGWCS